MAHQIQIVHQTGKVHPNFYAAMAQNIEPYSIRSYAQYSPSNIDDLVAIEMTRQKANYFHEEQQYVDQMISENPVVVERRNNTIGASSSGGSTATTSLSSDDGTNSNTASASSVQQQRADSCRRSRINNKIKKAKLRFRHQFVSLRLEQSAQTLARIHDAIRQAEEQLISRSGGCSESALVRLRQQMGVKDYSGISRNHRSSISPM